MEADNTEGFPLNVAYSSQQKIPNILANKMLQLNGSLNSIVPTFRRTGKRVGNAPPFMKLSLSISENFYQSCQCWVVPLSETP